jgi:TatD DNase family protein
MKSEVILLIDAHLHLDQYPEEDIDRLIEQWRSAGIQAVVAVSKDLMSAYKTLELKQRFPEFIYAAVGFHPEQPLPEETDTNELLALIECEREHISAIGEVGLPHYTLNTRAGGGVIEKYKELLHAFFKTAKKNDLPLALHAVHDHASLVLKILQDYEIKKVHFHWLKGDQQTIQNILDSGYYLSLTPEVCYRERDQKLAAVAPVEQLMVETDGPWPFSGKFEEKTTTPLFLKDVVTKIAEIKKQPTEEIEKHCNKNVEKVYGSL